MQKISDEDESELISLYRKGHLVKDIAEKLGVSGSTVCNYGALNGLRRQCTADEVIEMRTTILKLHEAGYNWRQISEKSGHSTGTIWKTFKENGIKMRKQPPYSSAIKDEAVRLYQWGTPTMDIAERFGMTPATLYYWLEKRGIPRKQTAPTHFCLCKNPDRKWDKVARRWFCDHCSFVTSDPVQGERQQKVSESWSEVW